MSAPRIENTTIKISLTTARYILETATRLVSQLHGATYHPDRGVLTDTVDSPSLYEQQPATNSELLNWLSIASTLLRVISGIVSHQLLSLEDGTDADTTDDDEGRGLYRILFNALPNIEDGTVVTGSHYTDIFDSLMQTDGYETDDEDDNDPEILYGAQPSPSSVFDHWD